MTFDELQELLQKDADQSDFIVRLYKSTMESVPNGIIVVHEGDVRHEMYALQDINVYIEKCTMAVEAKEYDSFADAFWALIHDHKVAEGPADERYGVR